MKFSDLQERAHAPLPTVTLEEIDIWDEHGIPTIDVVVEYEYEEESYSDHPYGEGTARETHPSSLDVYSVVTITPTQVFDEAGEVIQVIPAGTDMRKAPFWTPSDYNWFVDQVINSLN